MDKTTYMKLINTIYESKFKNINLVMKKLLMDSIALMVEKQI